MNIYKFITFSYLFFIVCLGQAQIRVVLIKTDCAENFKPSFCEEAYQTVHKMLDSLQHYLGYQYVSYKDTISRKNLILTYVTFKPHPSTRDTCLQIKFLDARTHKNIESSGPSCTGPIKFNQVRINSGVLRHYLITMHRSLTGLTPSWLEVMSQTYFEKPSLFFEFDKVHFNTKLSKKTRKKIYLIIHNILVQKQVWERKFNFHSKYTAEKVEATEDTKLHIAFVENPEDKDTFIIHIYLVGKKVIDIMPYTNEKIERKVVVNKERIKNGDYVELIDKLSLIYLWVIINSDA